MSRAALLALLLALAGPHVRAQDGEPEVCGDGTFTFDDADGTPGGVLTFDDEDDEEAASCLRGPRGPEELARDLRALVERKRAAHAPDAEWWAASLLPTPTSPTPRGLLAALDAERARFARGSAHHEGPGGQTARYLGFTVAVCRHGRRAPALLALLQTLRPHPWLADARRLVLGGPALDAFASGWVRLGAPDPLAPRVQAWVQGERGRPWRAEERRAGGCGGVLTFDDDADDPTHLTAGTLVTGADGGTYLVDASLRRWPLALDPESSPTPFLGVRAPDDPWDLLAAALRARRRGDEAGALRSFAAAVAASRRDGAGLVREALHRAARNARVALVDDLARGAAVDDVVRRLRDLDAVDPEGPEPTGLAARLAGLGDQDPAPWTCADWPELGVEARLELLTAALTAVHGVVPARQASSGGCFVFEDCEAKDEEVVPAPLRPLIDRWAELGWDGIGGLVALFSDARPTRVVEAGRREPWTVGEVAARLFVRLTGADLDDLGDQEGRAAFGAAFWEQHGERGPRAYYLGRLECPECPDPSDLGLLIFLRAQPTLATAWIESRLAASPADVVAWADLYVRAGAPLTAALEAGLREALLGGDLDVARAVAGNLASDPRFAAERQALCWRLALAGHTDSALGLLRTLPRPPSALVLAVAEALDATDLEELPPGTATDLVHARRLVHPRELRDLVLAAQLAAPEVQGDPLLLLYAVDTLRLAQEERATLEGLVALADALDDLGPRLTPALLDQASDVGLWLHRAYGARAAAGDAAAATARDAIGAWWAGAATRVAGIDRGPCLPAPLVEPLSTTLDADTLAAALGTLEERGRLRAQVAIDAEAGRGGLQLRIELGPRPEEHAVGWWTLRVDVFGPGGELLSTTEACTGEATERWVRPTLADALAALRATPGARLVLRATPP